jgi:hypothetical protein
VGRKGQSCSGKAKVLTCPTATPGCFPVRSHSVGHVSGDSAISLAEPTAVTLGPEPKVGPDVETLEPTSTLESQ